MEDTLISLEVLSYLSEIERRIIAQSKEAQKEQLVSVGEGLEFADQLADAVFLSVQSLIFHSKNMMV